MFTGCTLTGLWYDGEISRKQADEWAEQYEAKEALVLLSNFDVDASGGDGSLNPNSTYTDWNWILVRNSDSEAWTKDMGLLISIDPLNISPAALSPMGAG